MSIIIDSAKQAWNNVLDFMMRDSRRANVDRLLQESAKWQPNGEFFDYKPEMQNRLDYWGGNMGPDMRPVLKRHYEQTHKKMEKDLVTLPLVKKEMTDKAQVFTQSGDVTLFDDKGEQAKKANKLFEEIKRNSGLWSALKDTDLCTQLQHRSMLKFWWDTRAEQVRCSVWPCNLVDIVPNPERWWDVDAAWAVLFTLPGVDGNSSTDKRHEVWGVRDWDAVAVGMSDTVHFTTDGNRDFRYNKNDENPFLDPRTDEPMYPFVWFQDDQTTDLYKLGDTELLTVNRQVNSALTDMMYGMRYSCQPVWVHTKAEGGGDLGVKTMDPGLAVDIVAGASLEPKTPDLNVTEQWNVLKEIMETRALFGGLSPTAVRADAAAPESGYALKIRDKPLAIHRTNLVEIYRPYVEEAVYRMCVVHNLYAKDKITGLENLRVKWEPGEIDEIEDPVAKGTQYAAEIEADVSTTADWRAERYDETKEEAIDSVEANIEYNSKRKEKRMENSPFAQAMDKVGKKPPFGKKEDEEEETDKNGKPIPKTDEGDEPASKPAPKGLPEPSKEEKNEVEKSDLKLNVYQMAVAIDRGAATPVDLRMLLFPEESEAEATAAVKKSVAFNNQLAAILAKAKAIEAKALEGKKKKKPEGEE